MHKTFLYLTRRNKKGSKILLTFFNHNKILATRLKNLDVLKISDVLKNEIFKFVYDNRMDWELWIETAKNYQELRNNLKLRGYSKIAVNSLPMFSNIVKEKNKTNNLKPKLKTMLKKR